MKTKSRPFFHPKNGTGAEIFGSTDPSKFARNTNSVHNSSTMSDEIDWEAYDCYEHVKHYLKQNNNYVNDDDDDDDDDDCDREELQRRDDLLNEVEDDDDNDDDDDNNNNDNEAENKNLNIKALSISVSLVSRQFRIRDVIDSKINLYLQKLQSIPQSLNQPVIKDGTITLGKFIDQLQFIFQANKVKNTCADDILNLLADSTAVNGKQTLHLPIRLKANSDSATQKFSSTIKTYLAEKIILSFDICSRACSVFVGEYKDAEKCRCGLRRLRDCTTKTCKQNRLLDPSYSCYHPLYNRKAFKFVHYRPITTALLEILSNEKLSEVFTKSLIRETLPRQQILKSFMDGSVAIDELCGMQTVFERRYPLDADQTVRSICKKQDTDNEESRQYEVISIPLLLSLFYDGGQLYKSVTSNFWPIILSILNIITESKNVIGLSAFLSGLFTSKTGTVAESFLFTDCLCEELKMLYEEGKEILIGNKCFFIQARLVSHVLDTKAYEKHIQVKSGCSKAGCPLCVCSPGTYDKEVNKVMFLSIRGMLPYDNPIRYIGQSGKCCPSGYYEGVSDVNFVSNVKKDVIEEEGDTEGEEENDSNEVTDIRIKKHKNVDDEGATADVEGDDYEYEYDSDKGGEMSDDSRRNETKTPSRKKGQTAKNAANENNDEETHPEKKSRKSATTTTMKQTAKKKKKSKRGGMKEANFVKRLEDEGETMTDYDPKVMRKLNNDPICCTCEKGIAIIKEHTFNAKDTNFLHTSGEDVKMLQEILPYLFYDHCDLRNKIEYARKPHQFYEENGAKAAAETTRRRQKRKTAKAVSVNAVYKIWNFNNLPYANIARHLGGEPFHTLANLVRYFILNLKGERLNNKIRMYCYKHKMHKHLYTEEGEGAYVLSNAEQNRVDAYINCINVPKGQGSHFDVKMVFQRTGQLNGTGKMKFLFALINFSMLAMVNLPKHYKNFFRLFSKAMVELYSYQVDRDKMQGLLNRITELLSIHLGLFPPTESVLCFQQLLDYPLFILEAGPIRGWEARFGEQCMGTMKGMVPDKGGTSADVTAVAKYLEFESSHATSAADSFRYSEIKSIFEFVPHKLQSIVRPWNMRSAGVTYDRKNKRYYIPFSEYEMEHFILSLQDAIIFFSNPTSDETNIGDNDKHAHYASPFYRILSYYRHNNLNLIYEGGFFGWIVQWAIHLHNGNMEAHIEEINNKRRMGGNKLKLIFRINAVDGNKTDIEIEKLMKDGKFIMEDIPVLVALAENGFKVNFYHKSEMFSNTFQTRGFQFRENEPHGPYDKMPKKPGNILKNNWHTKDQWSSWCKFHGRTENIKSIVEYGQINAFILIHFPEDKILHGRVMASVTARQHEEIEGVSMVDGEDEISYHLFDSVNLFSFIPITDIVPSIIGVVGFDSGKAPVKETAVAKTTNKQKTIIANNPDTQAQPKQLRPRNPDAVYTGQKIITSVGRPEYPTLLPSKFTPIEMKPFYLHAEKSTTDDENAKLQPHYSKSKLNNLGKLILLELDKCNEESKINKNQDQLLRDHFAKTYFDESAFVHFIHA